MVTGYIFGNKAFYDQDSQTFRWLDDGLEVEGNPRPCPQCGQLPNENGHDPCIGTIPGVVSACCGHGIHDGIILWHWADEPRGELGEYLTIPAPEDE